jgi:hypothetical protein
MKLNFSDKIRKDYKGYMEPLLLTACDHQAKKLNITRSKYIRYAVIKKLIEDSYPLNCMSTKFNKFYKGITEKK